MSNENLPLAERLDDSELARITELHDEISHRLQQFDDCCVLALEVCNYSVDLMFRSGSEQMVLDLRHIVMGLGLLLQKNNAG